MVPAALAVAIVVDLEEIVVDHQAESAVAQVENVAVVEVAVMIAAGRMAHVMSARTATTRKVLANHVVKIALRHRCQYHRCLSNRLRTTNSYLSRVANFCRSLATLGEITAAQYDCVGCSAK